MKYSIALAQTHIQIGDVSANLRIALQMIAEAARRGSKLVLLPELWPCGYDLPQAVRHASATPEILAELNPGIDRYLQRATGHPELQTRGEELRQRTQQIGFHGATTLVVVGRKA